jgi:DNA-binding PucR family transcriptional regulator
VRVYLESYRSQSRTARLVHVHRNTVGNRIQRAEELLGFAVAKSRPELYAALVILKEVSS